MEKVRIHGATWLSHTKSASLGGDNVGIGPTHFEWLSEEDEGYGDEPVFWCDGAIKDGSGGVAWLVEPKELHPENYQVAALRHDEFEYILTYDKEMLDTIPNARLYPFGGSWIDLGKWGIYSKSKDVCMIVSSKNTMPGHKLRHQIAENFGEQIDIYGDEFQPFESKFDVLKDYRYAIVVESERRDFYFTEKLIDAISVGCIPIYWGCPSIWKFFGLVVPCIFTFDDMLWLRVALQSVVPDTSSYNAKINNGWIARNIENAKQYRICEDWIWEHYPDIFGRSNDA